MRADMCSRSTKEGATCKQTGSAAEVPVLNSGLHKEEAEQMPALINNQLTLVVWSNVLMVHGESKNEEHAKTWPPSHHAPSGKRHGEVFTQTAFPLITSGCQVLVGDDAEFRLDSVPRSRWYFSWRHHQGAQGAEVTVFAQLPRDSWAVASRSYLSEPCLSPLAAGLDRRCYPDMLLPGRWVWGADSLLQLQSIHQQLLQVSPEPLSR